MGELLLVAFCFEAVVSQLICYQFIFLVHLWFDWLMPPEPFLYSKLYYSPDSHNKNPHHCRITTSNGTICLWLQIRGSVCSRRAALHHPDDKCNFPEKPYLCWAVVIELHCAWLSCLRAMRLVMWLTYLLTNIPSNLFTFTQPFCTLHCYTYMNQSRCTWRRLHSLHVAENEKSLGMWSWGGKVSRPASHLCWSVEAQGYISCY